jgi:signal transduction histidine kinase
MKIVSQVLASFTVIAAAFAATIYVLPFLTGWDTTSAELLSMIMFVVIGAMAAVAVMITRTVLHPLGELTEASKHIAKGDLDREIYNGKITKNTLKNADELTRLALTFEMTRRRVIELENSSMSKISDLGRIKEELIEKEMVLQRANAELVGQREDLQKINDDLSSKNEELTAAYEKVQKLDKMKTDFILIAAHELRTPIQPILGSIELAEKGMITTDDAWKTILTETRRLVNVADYILDVGKIEAGTFTYEMKPVNLKRLIETVTSASSKLASDAGVININVALDRDDVTIVGDNERLVQAFANIINNAVKFAGNGTIKIKTHTNSDKGLVSIKIIDAGPGIPPEILSVLFNKFVTKTRENVRGTGLGLFITKTIIEAHNGTITAENNGPQKKGATFTISLPIKVQQVQSPAAAT